MDESDAVGRFFDALKDDYTAAIERCFPRYREMLRSLLDYLPQDGRFNRILDLGCGTGNLSFLISETYPDAEVCVVDVSRESLDVCRGRLGDSPRFEYQQRDFRRLQYARHSFDLVVSSIAIHHLTSREKQDLFRSIHSWLQPRGIFSYADQFRGATDDLYSRHMANWKAQSIAAGASEEEFAMWMDHQQEHDHHDTLKQQFDWLISVGFATVDCPWRYLLWSVVQAVR